jgi:UDP-N-acetylmuramate: L-alanyl-gamma-D-glutamyl-meso-diaminopimelate ligase
MRARLPESFDGAAQVYAYSGGVNWDVAESLAPLGDRAADYRDLDQLVRALVVVARPGDHILIMSNGGFGGIHGKLLQALPTARKAAA